jgi:hypothetical protein
MVESSGDVTTRSERETGKIGKIGDGEHFSRTVDSRLINNMIVINKYMRGVGLISVVIYVQLISVRMDDSPYPMYDICVHGNGF